MPNNDAVLSALSLARRAGKLTMGFDAVMKSAAMGEAFAVVVSSSASEKTRKEAAFRCEMYDVPLYEAGFTMDEAERMLGKHAGIFSLSDENFLRLVMKKLEQEAPGTID